MFPIIFQTEAGPIYSYGALRLLSYVAVAAMLLLTSKRLNESFSYAARAMVFMVLSGLIGARLGFVLVNWNQPWTLNLVFSSHGSLYFVGILGGLVGLFVFARVKGSSVGTAFDLVTPSMVAMWAIGNIGCFMAGCCMGSPTTLPWGMRFLSESTPAELRDVPVHPAQLYSSAVELMLLVLLFTWRRHVEGELFLRAAIVLLTMHVVFAMGGISPAGFHTGSILYVCLDIAAVIVLITRRSKSQMLQRG